MPIHKVLNNPLAMYAVGVALGIVIGITWPRSSCGCSGPSVGELADMVSAVHDEIDLRRLGAEGGHLA